MHRGGIERGRPRRPAQNDRAGNVGIDEAEAVSVVAGSRYELDWTAVSVDGLGDVFVPESVSSILVAGFEPGRDLAAAALDFGNSADVLYSIKRGGPEPLPALTDLGDPGDSWPPIEDDDRPSFPGFTQRCDWMLALSPPTSCLGSTVFLPIRVVE